MWRDVDSAKFSTALQELVKLNLDKYQNEDWNLVIHEILKQYNKGSYYNEHEINLSQVLLVIVPRYVQNTRVIQM